VCGTNSGDKPVGVREWKCPACGALLDRDYDAAVNLLTAGPAVYACGRDRRL
jgi:Transposase and inactivated derivatives